MASSSIFYTIKKIRSLLTRGEKWQWGGIVVFGLCNAILEVVTASIIVIFAQVLNDPAVGKKYMLKLGVTEYLSPSRTIFYISLACGGVYLVKNIFSVCEAFYQNFIIQKMGYYFKNKLLQRYAESEYSFYLTRNSSFGVNVIASDGEQLFSGGLTSLAIILSEGLVFLCLVGMVIFMNPSLALIVFGIGCSVGFLVTKVFLPLFYKWGQKLQEASLMSHQNLLQFFHAFKEIVLMGKCDTFIKAYQAHSKKRSKIQAFQLSTNSLPRVLIEILFVGIFVLTISYLCLEKDTPQQMLGILGGYLYVGFRLMPGLNRTINQLNTFKYVTPSIERVWSEYHTVAVKENYLNIPGFHFDKTICFKDVAFNYPNTDKDALKGINLEIKKGECIGIVGETGSGKSTLVDILLGLLKPSTGEVLVDSQYPVSSYQWHQRIGYVPQAIYLIDDTIEFNIAFGEKSEDIDTNHLNAAIDAAQLRSLINNLPQGVKTIVGERGVRLSGGERQRISIARALYRNPDVLIFDEATSALDSDTESRLMETIHSVSKNRTVIMIAHRLTTLKDCDRIIVMGGGAINQITDYEHVMNFDKNHYKK